MILFHGSGLGGKEFIRIYDEYNVAIYRYAFMRCYSIEVAQDITAETFLKAWDYFSKNPNYKPDNLRAYLYKIASNLIFDYFKNNPKNILLDSEQALDFYKNLNQYNISDNSMGEISYVVKALNSLIASQKEVLIFRYVEDLPYKDIATIMDKTEGALRVLHNRAIENLRKKLGI